ncbi:MAG: phasin [Rhizobiales bacterium 24-66-13]|jgi:phasin|uniref:phasin n=1 Tax=Roseixanthobacter finlandensis TaxID=3119922 RepID=UPI000BC769B1|nr:MAG: phasin [Rhizobiales bacterium 24-66-13]OZA94970.1 MAG: phasin [Rhizobiales bacterium 39-66-18]HQS08748.1 phasin [Xanthobacteraceae bacterium]HQS45569.1 phasin [Xanthobacteraceae bacterium]
MNDTFAKAFQDQMNAANGAFSKMEVPAAFREMAEKSVESYRDNYEKLKAAATQTSDILEDSYSTASKGVSEYNLKSLEILRSNVNAAFDFFASVVSAKSAAEAVELSTSHLRHQFDALSGQAKELSALAQKIATESSEPIKAGVEKTLNKAA